MSTDFDRAFEAVIGVEAGLSMDPEDPGNWTGGAKGRGELRGTKYGISASSYPNVDIKALTPAAAKAIYRPDYWDQVKADSLPWPLSMFAFDAAVNQGIGAAARMLQKVAGVPQDGIIGPATIAALKRNPEAAARFMAARAQRYIGTRNFDRNGDGWFFRLFTITLGASK